MSRNRTKVEFTVTKNELHKSLDGGQLGVRSHSNRDNTVRSHKSESKNEAVEDKQGLPRGSTT